MEDDRALATIARIADIQPIPGADAIEVATIRGWKTVAKKGEFQQGDLCVFCEIDSVLPDRPEFEFLKPRGFRIKTMKLRGQISQGIAFPLTILPPSDHPQGYFRVDREGDNVTDLLGITKYEVPIPANMRGLVKGSFPVRFLRRTDEERIQNIPWVLEKYRDTAFYATEKLDGSSITCYLKDGEFGVCSRNLELKETADNVFWQTARACKVEEEMRGDTDNPMKNWALQGEVVGAGVSGNRYEMKDRKIYFFNAFDIDNQRFLGFEEFSLLFEFLNLPRVPVVAKSFFLPKTLDDMLMYADGKSRLNEKKMREGIVVRSIKEINDIALERTERLSFKVISNKYLLKEEP